MVVILCDNNVHVKCLFSAYFCGCEVIFIILACPCILYFPRFFFVNKMVKGFKACLVCNWMLFSFSLCY